MANQKIERKKIERKWEKIIENGKNYWEKKKHPPPCRDVSVPKKRTFESRESGAIFYGMYSVRSISMSFSEYMPSWNGVIFFGQTCSTLTFGYDLDYDLISTFSPCLILSWQKRLGNRRCRHFKPDTVRTAQVVLETEARFIILYRKLICQSYIPHITSTLFFCHFSS